MALAGLRFGALSEAELRVLRAVPRGDVAYCGPSEEYRDPSNDPSQADDWGPEREIRAELLCWLCVEQLGRLVLATESSTAR
jgi:hypothetical protein